MRAFFQVIDRQEEKWKRLVSDHIGVGAKLVACSESSVNRRVYEHGSRIYKIITSHEKKYRNTLHEEFKVLKTLQGIDCVPEVVSYETHDGCSVLELKKYEGEQIGQFGDLVSSKVSIPSIISAFVALNKAGVRHGDAHVRNILFLPDGQVKIIDFDQAIFTTTLRSFIGDFLGIGPDRGARSVSRLLLHIIFARLPSIIRNRVSLGKLLRRSCSHSRSINSGGVEGIKLSEIWQLAGSSQANSPNRAVSYYSLRYGDVVLLGERAWEPRWASISSRFKFKGKRLLELGCNLGLLSCYAQHSGALDGGMAIDHDDRVIESAKTLAQIAGVNISFRVCNFDSDQIWENDVPVKSFNVVSALSVVNWLKEKERFLTFLSKFPELIYEGHDSIQIEIGRLNSIGFYKIQVISVSERGRVVLLASK